jgi:hypothetical protein
VNRFCLFFRALSRTPRNPWDTLSPLWVRRVLDSMMFSLVTGLPSTTSAADFLGLVRQLRKYYARVRLLAGVPARIVLLPSRTGPPIGSPGGFRRGLSVLARAVSRRAYDSRPTPDLWRTRLVAPPSVSFPMQARGRRPVCVFRSSIPRPSMPLSTLHPAPRGTQRKTRGQDGWLLLSCGALSSPPARRFIPTIALAHGRGSETHLRVCNEVPSRDPEGAVYHGAARICCKSSVRLIPSSSMQLIDRSQKVTHQKKRVSRRDLDVGDNSESRSDYERYALVELLLRHIVVHLVPGRQ